MSETEQIGSVICSGCGRSWSEPAPESCPECGTEFSVEEPVEDPVEGPVEEKQVTRLRDKQIKWPSRKKSK